MPTPALPASVQLRTGSGGLSFLRVTTAGGSGEVFLHGAHLVSWTPAGQSPVLWMSGTSRFAENTPIRGGVPICFPWFGMHADHPEAPQHGFARLSDWELSGASEHGPSTSLEFRLSDTDRTRASAWPHRFEAIYTVTIGSELRLRLEVVNRDTTDVSFEAALHNYYAIGDILATRVYGLEGHEFTSSTETGTDEVPLQLGNPVDRRYPTVTTAQIEDAASHRVISITSAGSAGAVLWNPGQDKARAMEDFDDDGWPHMVCLETANIGDSQITLAPGERHSMSATIRVEAR
ncbi:MAG TPA: D-hexose-6-phosphate mutarotase [Terrimesophilobacter sp.]|jgi:Uncharacterized enzymes related to aldose 1-epimerase|uniref:D-hexose-6-phosphate mutarotase n=1 Tax=Terrimesophilobacter sp. TaxID=2906435 RepID=UPI002F954091